MSYHAGFGSDNQVSNSDQELTRKSTAESLCRLCGSKSIRCTSRGKAGSDKNSGRSSIKWVHPSSFILMIFASFVSSKKTLPEILAPRSSKRSYLDTQSNEDL